MEEEKQEELIQPLQKIPQLKLISPITIAGAVVIILSGLATGFVLSKNQKKSVTATGQVVDSSKIRKGDTFGSEDTKTFRDTTEGTLEQGGVFGEGSHKLIRPGGDSQTVALTSSVVSLDEFVGRKVKIWGETQTAEKSGWFMDVGRLEVLE